MWRTDTQAYVKAARFDYFRKDSLLICVCWKVMHFNNTPLLVGFSSEQGRSFGLLVWDPLDDGAPLQVELGANETPYMPEAYYVCRCGVTQLNSTEFLVYTDNTSSVWRLDYGKVESCDIGICIALTEHINSSFCHASVRCPRCAACTSSLPRTYWV